tara:strand:+ start:457 stop:1047 length:591 start_codon:yes stop_codon:yes gene_type:complete
MSGIRIVKIFFILFVILSLCIWIYSKFFKTIEINDTLEKIPEDKVYSSNIMENVNYSSIDTDGKEYIITALKGEIDYTNPNKIYLTKVKALIKLKNSENVTITSEYGKYNSENYDTIFSKSVKINYLDHEITGEYLDFSLERNLMLISKKVIYSNLDNTLRADVIEVDIKTKNTKIFMYEKDKKVKIKNKELNGNN